CFIAPTMSAELLSRSRSRAIRRCAPPPGAPCWRQRSWSPGSSTTSPSSS
ncbi:MAG: hypothetical protein AVDCRST_MAG76-2483, partial [uncultured Acidimicrobiales bacterium]